ncbi:CD209 antigen-like isoform X2 [Glandiceps talaboti]
MLDFMTYKMWYFAVISLVLVCSSYCQLTTSNTRKCVTKEIHYNTYEKDCKPACGFGWYYFKNKCYFIKESEFYTYDEAETLCQGMDSQLVIINDADVDLFLRDFGSRANIWIGLTDRDVEGTFRWADNSTTTVVEQKIVHNLIKLMVVAGMMNNVM